MSETMGMGIGTNNQNTDEGAIKGRQFPVACGAWYTSKGHVIPHIIKYEDNDGLIHTLSDFNILFEEDKFYCGIPATQYFCQYINEHSISEFWLLHYVEKKQWKMWFKY